MNRTLTAVRGLKVGHAHDEAARTGCTVVLFEPEAEVACEARGGWPGTYDTHSIDVARLWVKKNAIFLTGGDVFGLDTSIGVRRYILEQGLTTPDQSGGLPGIVGANIYDLRLSMPNEARYPELGYSACRNSSTDPIAEGNVGAGMGATVAKLKGFQFACKGGCGTSAVQLPNQIVVGAIVITNALGNVYESRSGQTIAGIRSRDGRFLEFEEITTDYLQSEIPYGNTTIGVVATNLELPHEHLIKVAQMAHDGLAMSIRPAHMTEDGDTLFAASTGTLELRRKATTTQHVVDVIGYAGAQCVAAAVVSSVKAARTLMNIPVWNDLENYRRSPT